MLSIQKRTFFLETRPCGQVTNNIKGCEAEPYFTTENKNFFNTMHILRDLLKKPRRRGIPTFRFAVNNLDLAVLTGFMEKKSKLNRQRQSKMCKKYFCKKKNSTSSYRPEVSLLLMSAFVWWSSDSSAWPDRQSLSHMVLVGLWTVDPCQFSPTAIQLICKVMPVIPR